MIKFQDIYEWFFKSFRIKGGFRLVEQFRQEGVKHLMIIRRSWIYGIFVNLLLILIIIITFANISLILENFASAPFIGYGISGLIGFSILLTVYSGLAYLFHFHKAHGRNNDIMDVHEWQTSLELGSVIFSRFFNQVTLSYFLCIIIVLFEVYYFVSVSWAYATSAGYLGTASIIVQVVLISYYRLRMIDLEMDYILVIPGKIYFIDQVGVQTNIQTLQLMSNIKIIQSSYPNFVGSFFDFWTIEIILDTMAPNLLGTARALHMHYVTKPIETVNKINKLLVDYEQAPIIMDNILKEIGMSGYNPDDPEVRKDIGEYLLKHEEHMKRLFFRGDDQEKNEIRRIYKKYIPRHPGF